MVVLLFNGIYLHVIAPLVTIDPLSNLLYVHLMRFVLTMCFDPFYATTRVYVYIYVACACPVCRFPG